MLQVGHLYTYVSWHDLIQSVKIASSFFITLSSRRTEWVMAEQHVPKHTHNGLEILEIQNHLGLKENSINGDNKTQTRHRNKACAISFGPNQILSRILDYFGNSEWSNLANDYRIEWIQISDVFNPKFLHRVGNFFCCTGTNRSLGFFFSEGISDQIDELKVVLNVLLWNIFFVITFFIYFFGVVLILTKDNKNKNLNKQR